MKTTEDLRKALETIPFDCTISASHGTTELYYQDETERFRKFFSFIEPEENRE